MEDTPEQKRRDFNIIKRWESQDKTSNGSARKFAHNEIERICSELGVSHECANLAKNLYDTLFEMNMTRGRSTEGIVGACVYIVCKQKSVPKSSDDIAKFCRVTQESILSTYQKVKDALDIHLEPEDPEKYLDNFVNNINEILDRENRETIPHATKERAREIISMIKESSASSGKKPKGVCASAIYLAAKTRNRSDVTQKHICEVADISELTLRRGYQDQQEMIEKDAA